MWTGTTLLVLASVAAGCGRDTATTRWRIRFADASIRDRTVLVDARVRAGGCNGVRTVLRFEVPAGSSPSAPADALPDGAYGLVVEARDADCFVQAQACVEIEVPLDDEVSITLEAREGERPYGCPGAGCNAGACAEPRAPVGCEGRGPAHPLALGKRHAAAVGPGCEPYGWGANDRAQLGGEVGDAVTTPQAVSQAEVVQVSAGAAFTCFVDVTGTVICVGAGDRGQLGTGDASDRSEPAMVPVDSPFAMVTAAEDHACAVTLDGDLFCWGEAGPHLGIEDAGDTLAPAPVATDEPVRYATAGGTHACAITDSGGLLCWGDNDLGQLGLGPTGPPASSSPMRLEEPCWAQVAAGGRHACAIDCRGRLLCWGDNAHGQAGTADPVPVVQPAEIVAGDERWVRVAAGDSHSCALRADETIWCWGSNGGESAGALGIGPAVEETHVPAQVVGSGWTDVAAGGGSTCALHGATGFWCWGRNDVGQLGTADTETRFAPAPVASGPTGDGLDPTTPGS